MIRPLGYNETARSRLVYLSEVSHEFHDNTNRPDTA